MYMYMCGAQGRSFIFAKECLGICVVLCCFVGIKCQSLVMMLVCTCVYIHVHVHVPGLAEVGGAFMVILATVSLGGGRSLT